MGLLSNEIPLAQRVLVQNREMRHCFRCGGPAPNGHWHHRRTRSVRDEHQHCACNGVWLCGTCHGQVHAQPLESRRQGWIVSRHTTFPGSVPATAHFGSLDLFCDGRYRYHITSESETRSNT